MRSAALTRRQVLAGGAALGLAAVAPALARRRRRVVVVGAGLAGLAAADELRRAGWDVVVLEATGRVGGRVMTLRGFTGGQVAEAGGEYIDSNHRTMRRYARRFGLPLDDVYAAGSDNPGCVYLRGKRRSPDGRYSSGVDHFYRALARLSGPLDPSDPVADGARLDGRSVADFLDGLRLPPGTRAHIEHAIIRDDYTVEARDLSLLFLAQGDSLPGGQEERFRVHGGNDQIPAALAARLGSRVHRGTPVTAIARSARSVVVTAAGEAIAADACVLAAPLPALRLISFSPALPGRLASAVANLAYGQGAKIALQYASRIWRTQGFNGDTFTDLPLCTAWEATDAQPGRAGILLGYAMGDPGRAALGLDPGQRIAAAAADVETIYPGAGAALTGADTAAWEHSYTAYAPGQVTAYWRALRRPVGRIVLAGEHTDALTAYMEGAARSGRRAARTVRRITGA